MGDCEQVLGLRKSTGLLIEVVILVKITLESGLPLCLTPWSEVEGELEFMN